MIIFSVEQAELHPRENMASTVYASKELGKEGTYVAVDGVYKGQSEVSFLTSQVELGKNLAREFRQECHLERGYYGIWYLVDTATDKVLDAFKTIKEVSRERALASECYTQVGDKYYLASRY